MSNKDFLEKFKIKKALDGFRVQLNYGDKLHMFNCLYKVVKFDDKGYTMLEDDRNSRFALPSDKLMLMMKKGLIKNFGLLNLNKAQQISGPSRKIGVTPKAVNQAYSGKGEGSGKPGPQGEPVGTTKQGADGEWYKKVQDHPSMWVHVGKGTSHVSPGSEASNPLADADTQHKFSQIRAAIKQHAHPEDHDKLIKLAENFVEEQSKFKNKLASHNAGDIDQKGNKLPKTGVARSAMQDAYAHQDKAIEIKKKLIDLIKESRKKVNDKSKGKE